MVATGLEEGGRVKERPFLRDSSVPLMSRAPMREERIKRGESMRKTTFFTFAMLVVLVVTLSVMTVAARKGQIISGTIKKVDIPRNTLSLETLEGNQLTYSIDPQTKITLHGKPSALPDLKIGQNVTVEASGDIAIFITG